MSNNTCPNCGSPMRPGVRFCGSCGKAVPPSTPPPAKPAPAGQQMSACPNCGNPIRAGAKFCSACGKTIEQIQPVPRPVAPGAGAPQPQAPTPAAPAARPVPPGSPPPASPKTPRKGSWVWVVIALLFICLLSATGAGLLWYIDPFELFGQPTPTPPAFPTPSVTAPLPTVAPPSHTPLPTDTLAPPAATDTPLPTPSATLTPVPSTAEPVGEPTLPQPSGTTLLQENFDEPLPSNWVTWGTPEAQIIEPTGNPFASLSGAAGGAGITSKRAFNLRQGLDILFTTLLISPKPEEPLVFDLDLGDGARNPGEEPGMMRIKISLGKVIVESSQFDTPCEGQLVTQPEHVVRIRILNQNEITVAVDNNVVCSVDDLVFEPPSVTLSLSGIGWIDNVQVLRP